MKNLIVFALLAQAAAPAAAGFDLPSMPAGAIAASTEWRQTAAVPYRAETPEDVFWTYLYEDTFGKGAAMFDYKGNKYSVKLLFRKGRFDEARNTYSARPFAAIINASDLKNNIPLERWLDLDEKVDFPFTTISGDKLKIKNDAGKLEIVSQGLFSKTVFSITHKELFALWEANARQFVRTVYGKTLYLVPQMVWTSEAGLSEIGFVASEGKPLADATGLPLDFVAVCHLKGNVDFKPVSYSTALGLKFRYVGDPSGDGDKAILHWRIEEIEKSELYDALDDEALEAALSGF